MTFDEYTALSDTDRMDVRLSHLRAAVVNQLPAAEDAGLGVVDRAEFARLNSRLIAALERLEESLAENGGSASDQSDDVKRAMEFFLTHVKAVEDQSR
ncbi:MAG: hypothetical protein AAGF88_08050 [Pseudomonadota bacterium]